MFKLTDQQTKALEMVKKHRLSLLIGYPGTGKTTITQRIVAWAKEQGHYIGLASPTGKAAQVLSEACGMKASTIHRLLKPQVSKKNGKLQFHFEHDKDNPLPYDFLIIDEVSMVGNGLMSSLMSAIDAQKTRVLLVGDPAQLPSVTPGNVLKDFVSCGMIPCVELTEVFRHSGAIVEFCTAIRTGEYYTLPKKLDIDNGGNYVHVECENPQIIHDTVVKLATVNMVKRGYNTTDDVQILSPTNSRTVLSCDSLNVSIQAIVNPQVNVIGKTWDMFRLGSKVINTKNIYDAISATSNQPEMILNGDMGMIIDLQDLESKSMIVQFENPERKIVLSKKFNYLKLAYCLTIHRSQGSQFPVVILPVHESFRRQSNRALIYTAVSRAQAILITVGQAAAIRESIQDVRVYERQTFLSQKIEERVLDGI